MSRNYNFLGGSAAPYESIMFLDGGPKLGVGVGTTKPKEKLHVVGNSVIEGNVGIGTNKPLAQLHVQGGPAAFITNVGIGTMDPTQALDVHGNALFNSTVRVKGKLFLDNDLEVRGTTTIVNSTNLDIQDAIVTINKGQTFPPTSLIRAGIEVDRGAASSNYQFVFEEATHLFKIGTRDKLQAVGTRPDIVSNKSIAFYDSTNKQYTFHEKTVVDPISGFIGIGTQMPNQALDVSGGNVRTSGQLISTATTGPPLLVSSSVQVQNLNAEYLGFNGYDSTFYRNVNNMNAGTLPVTRGGLGTNTLSGSKLLVANASGTSTITPGDLHWNPINSRLGIGTDKPDATLHVQGDVYATSKVRVIGDTVNDILIQGNELKFIGNMTSHWSLVNAKSTSSNFLSFITSNSQGSSGEPVMVLTPNKRVGIGLTDPGSKLSVGGTLSIHEMNGGIVFKGDANKGNAIVSCFDAINFSANPNTNSNADLRFLINKSQVSADYALEKMRLTESGYLGIGTNNPVQRLHVGGNGNLYVEQNIGIGNSDPIARFVINSQPLQTNGFDFASCPALIVNAVPTSGNKLNDSVPLLHLVRDGTPGQSHGARATFALSRYEHSGTNSRSRLDIVLADDLFADVNVATFLANGNIGIGNQKPGQRLDVTGSIRTTGQLISTVGPGTSPLLVESTTMVKNLNCELFGGIPQSMFPVLDKGVIPVASGGTGTNTFLAGTILVGNGSNPVASSSLLTWDNVNQSLGIGTNNGSAPLHIVKPGNNLPTFLLPSF